MGKQTKFNEQRDRKIVKMLERGTPRAKIRAKFGMTPDQLQYRVGKYGFKDPAWVKRITKGVRARIARMKR